MKKYPSISLISAISLAFLTTGCGIYRSGFECPPGRGVGCASTSEVLDMIIEKEPDSDDPFDAGKNLFIPDSRSCK